MRKAGRYHALRGLALGAALVVLALAGLGIYDRIVEQRKADYADGLVRALLNADIAQVPGIIDGMKDYRQWADSRLREEYAKAEKDGDAQKQLYASLALLRIDPGQREYLYRRLLDAAPREVPILRDELGAYKEDLIEKLWSVVE